VLFLLGGNMVNKKDIAKRITESNLITSRESVKIVDEIFEYIESCLMEGEEVSIVGFGKFFLYEHAPRPVRNPKTLEPMTLVPYKSVKFKLSDKIRKKLKK
jgi:nucleoid DNA-binding protein